MSRCGTIIKTNTIAALYTASNICSLFPSLKDQSTIKYIAPCSLRLFPLLTYFNAFSSMSSRSSAPALLSPHHESNITLNAFVLYWVL